MIILAFFRDIFVLGAGITPAKGLQYPFPSHPPVQPSAPSGVTMPGPMTSFTTPVSTSTTPRGSNHGDNRLKPCASVPSDNRTSSKVSVNRSVSSSVVVSNLTQIKTSDNTKNIPLNSSDLNTTLNTNLVENNKSCKSARDLKTSDSKGNEKVANRRNSSASSSPRSDSKSRRNSDCSTRKNEDGDSSKQSESEETDTRKERESRRERLEASRLMEKLERERLEQERLEKERIANEREEKERLERERLEKERIEKERIEKELKREREENERKEKEEKERREREEQLEKERLEKEKRERKEREERERREREELIEKERMERERRERKEREEKEAREREEREKRDREEREKREKEEQLEKERTEKEKAEKERRKEKEEERKHKEDTHDKRKEDHRHQIHRENNVNDKHDLKMAKDDNKKDSYDMQRKDSHESRINYDKNKHHIERDVERRKETKENRENNIYDKSKNFANEMREDKDRPVIESRHMSIEEKNRQYDGNSSRNDPNRRKERNNSLPATLGTKRRMSSHDVSLEGVDEAKRIKLNQEHKKLSERRDSKDSREDKSKNKHKNSTKSHEEKSRHDKHNNIREGDDKRKDKEDRHKNKQKSDKPDKQKIKSKSRDKDSKETPGTPKSPGKEITLDKDFLARLDLVEIEKQKHQLHRKEIREKRKPEGSENSEERKNEEMKRNEERRKHPSTERKREEGSKSSDERKMQKRDRIRKSTHNSSDNTDSDEPKKHSIFDIVDDEPAYISMYDKVKARSCKNMQKQEEEKRQEKIKAKFSQLKQSRAKREEKKRSTSWDEDSDSERENKSDTKRRGNKMLIASSDEENGLSKPRKRREIYSDSDSERHQRKSEQIESSDDDSVKQKILQRKGSKSRITSDTSDDDYKKIKTEVFSDNDDNFEDKYKKVKEIFDDVKIKRERKLSKHHESLEQINSQIFGDSNSPILEVKTEKIRRVFDGSSADETESRREKSEIRKKHKKKQKRQRSSFGSDDIMKMDTTTESIQSEDKKNNEKKKTHSKKDKKRDKSKDEEKIREKSKKSKKNRDVKNEYKHEGKMANIFGSLSDDSENGNKDQDNHEHKPTFLDRFGDENVQSSYNCASDSDSFSQIEKVFKLEEKEIFKEEKEIFKSEEKEKHLREEHRKRKEKRRREKEKRLREELNENSMDFVDLGKQLEDNIKDDNNEGDTEIKIEVEEEPPETIQEDGYKFALSEQDRKESDRKELKEKKKKRKKSKEERQRHHHHHHHEKSKIKTPEIKKEPMLKTEEIKIELEKQCPSLPNILELPSPPHSKSSPNLDVSVSPIPRSEPMISPIPKTPTSSKDKKRDKFIPGFGSEIDEKIHDSAVKSISEFESPKSEIKKELEDEKLSVEKIENNEKPRVIISQEETEDAVAALLGESFGGDQFEECYNDQVTNVVEQEVGTIQEENTQDDEEMRQAVQSLNSSELEIKPDTPQSEHELQIDTDTEEQEDISSRYEQPPRTPEMLDITQPPKTPDIPSYFRNEEQKPIIVNKTPTINSPPSLTPIKSTTIADAKRNLDVALDKIADKPLAGSLPEQSRTVISQNWKDNDKPMHSPTVKFQEVKTPNVQSTSIVTTVPNTSGKNVPSRIYSSAPVLRLTSPPPLKISESITSTKEDHSSPKLTASPITKPQLHNMPAQMPYKIPFQKTTSESSTLHSPKVSSANIALNRLPITPVMVPKSMQATTLLLPQSKVALTQNPTVSQELKLCPITTQQERPKMVYHGATSIPQFPTYVQQPRMVVQTNIHLQRPASLLVPTKPNSYVSNLPPPSYSLQSMEKQRATPSNISELPKLVPTSHVANQHHNVSQSMSSQPQTIIITSHAPTQKSFMPVIQETPKLVSLPSVNSDMRVSHSSIIQQTPKPALLVQAPLKEPTIVKEVPKETSLPPTQSPVIVKSNKEQVPMFKQEPVTKPTEPAKQLAIEKVTEELNLSLKKEEFDNDTSRIKDDSKPTVEVKSDKDVPILKQMSSEPTSLAECKPFTTPPNYSNSFDIKPFVAENKPLLNDNKPFLNDVKPIINESEPKPCEIKIEEPILESKDSIDNKPNIECNLSISDTKPVLKTEPILPVSVETKCTNEDKLPQDAIMDNKEIKDMENVSVIKETDKFEEEKGETDSIVSDISKGQADVLNKDDALDSKEDSDYWSAKEVNIDSVIKKVDALCSADELSDRSSEIGKDEKEEWFETEAKTTKLEKESENESHKIENTVSDIQSNYYDGVDNVEEEKEVAVRGGRRGGRARGRKTRGGERGGMQTRRGKVTKEVTVTTISRRGRGGRPKLERKISKSESETADVYEFRDDSDENNTNKDRPRLILTIKSPAVNNANGNTITQAVVKEVIKEPIVQTKLVETKEEFASPMTNTRKSRRLQEKDVSRNTVDDTIEDVVKNTIVTRSGSIQATRRSARQTTKVVQEVQRKSPRGGRKKDRRASEATDDEEKSTSKELNKPEVELKEQKLPEKETPKEIRDIKPELPKEKPHEGLKAAMLRRVKGEMNQEPMTLIDPVTGVLTPMRECEEGRYIPVAGQAQGHIKAPLHAMPHQSVLTKATESEQPTVITNSQPSVVLKQQKPQSLKAHVLSSQAAKAVATQQQPQPQTKPVTIPTTTQSETFNSKSVPLNEHLNVNVTLPNYVPSHLSPRGNIAMGVAKSQQGIKQSTALSPNHMAVMNHQQKQIPQTKQSSNKPIAVNHMAAQAVNIPFGLPKFNVKKQVEMMISGSPPGGRIVPNTKVMEPPKVEVSMAGCVMVPRTNVSPQGQTRHVLQAGMPGPAYEASLVSLKVSFF